MLMACGAWAEGTRQGHWTGSSCGLGCRQETVSVSGPAIMMLLGPGSFVFYHSVCPHTAWEALKALGLAP